jgi:quercetin dioxygenase-like cupin family protein
MKPLLLLFFFPLLSIAQTTNYSVSSFANQDLDLSKKAPNTHYIGNAWLSPLIQADQEFEYSMTLATFAANSTLDWHKHQTSQVLIVVEGTGYYQEKGKEVMVMKKGDIIKCDKDTEHWHSSSHESMVSYIAIYGNGGTIWTDKLTQEAYDNSRTK